ncbi:hypothetical protein P5673_001958 [Acropora cervicornis]|uniref:Uncharacterized protein n=1 Tax=Acropora cervicornis TaxID=6130 RepID=A0AAD9VGC5_ACRCE|nr:hypothetical protein P5673_001958 [Acropora cervicornis]
MVKAGKAVTSSSAERSRQSQLLLMLQTTCRSLPTTLNVLMSPDIHSRRIKRRDRSLNFVAVAYDCQRRKVYLSNQ